MAPVVTYNTKGNPTLGLTKYFRVGLGLFREGFGRGFNCFLGFGFHVGFGCFLAERIWWVILLFLGSVFVRALLYSVCVRRGALRFFNKVATLLIKKKYYLPAQKKQKQKTRK
jgi:hypothetical protein